MERKDIIINQRERLNDRYKQLIEKAYNLKETDHELSDISEYKAIKLLSRLKKWRLSKILCLEKINCKINRLKNTFTTYQENKYTIDHKFVPT